MDDMEVLCCDLCHQPILTWQEWKRMTRGSGENTWHLQCYHHLNTHMYKPVMRTDIVESTVLK